MTTRTRKTAQAVAVVITSCALLFTGFATAAADPGPVASLGTGSAGGSGSFGGNAASATPRLASVDNFRDIAGAGAGYAAAGGKTIARGVVYRSNALVPDDTDLATLQSLGLTAVYDLRSPAEIERNPDRTPAGAVYKNFPIFSGDIESEAQRVRSADEARALAQSVYRKFVTGVGERAGFAQLLDALATGGGAQVYHCNSGKDRTGWATAVLLGLAGVTRDTIMSDFLLTNEYSAKSIKAKHDAIAAQYGEQAAQIFDPILGVESNFLEAAFAQLDSSYGSFDKYVTDGLGLSAATVATLKAKLAK